MCLGKVGVITEVWDEGGVPMARLETTSTTTETVCLLAHPGLEEGARVLVHSGFVVQVLDPDTAAEAARLRSAAAGVKEGST